MGQNEGYLIAGCDRKLADGFHIFAAHGNRRAEQEHVRSGDGTQYAVFQPADPRDGTAIVEADHEFASHFDAAFNTDDNSYHVRRLAFRRHEIDQADTSFGIREGGLEDESALAISPVSDFGRCLRSYLPSTVLRLAEQRRETAIGIEAR